MAGEQIQVALPEVLSVLAHELRSPLSVLQGYIRLLQRARAADDPESSMLASMLEATARLALLGRQASDLAVFLKPSTAAQPTTVGDLLDELSRRGSPDVVVASITQDLRAWSVGPIHRAPLAAAVGALADSAMRDTGRRPARITAAATDGGVRLTITAGPDTPPASAPMPSPASPDPVCFSGGGLGLALVAASYVLAAHEVRVTRGTDGGVWIDLTRGAAA